MTQVGPRGRFITLEGGEAAGKTTQLGLLAEALERAGHRVVRTREPGGSPGAERLRELLLGGEIAWSAPAEVLLHFSARAEHVARKIAPALASGAWVVCDRFADSTMAYQGWGQRADRVMIAALTAMLPVRPDLTLVFDVSVATTQARLARRGGTADRYERLGAEFFGRVREGFAAVAAAEPERCEVIDGEPEVAAVAASAWHAVRSRLGVG